ncbi:hypothetical protein IID22_03830, partial [Patescibacteria group bacterium]|nr:hypothetical protein [Patescibacteria group bacterium]
TGNPGLMLKTGLTTVTHTYDTTTGAFVFVGAAKNKTVFFYPSTSVMGFTNYESDTISNEPSIAFDTQFAYQNTTGLWIRLSNGASTWTGTDSEFFWSTTYRGVTADVNLLFTTNYNTTDRIRYWDGTTWTSFSPTTRSVADNFVKSARLIIPFKRRLLLLNTRERVTIPPAGSVDVDFVNRVRWSQVGDPTDPLAFREDIKGRGDFLDFSTQEAIVSAHILRNRLIVYLERSTYEIVYTGNEANPFLFQQINAELGCESTFSIIPFDKVVLGIGGTGIHACNGANVERIDANIPDEVFEFHNNNEAPLRVAGIRDYYAEMVYWSVPDGSGYTNVPNRILAFNYKTLSWAFFDDSITAFGYIWNGTSDVDWVTSDFEWSRAGFAWNSSALEARQRSVLGGNQQGYTFLIERDITQNARSLSINNISKPLPLEKLTLKIINHNLRSGDWIQVEGAEGVTELNGLNFQVLLKNSDEVEIVQPPVITGTYKGGGTIRLISKIDILTKQFNFYISQGLQAYISKVDFYVEKTGSGADGAKGEITIDTYPSSSTLSLRDAGIGSGTILGNSILETISFPTIPLEDQMERFWHSVYFQAQGETIQLRIFWSDDQMRGPIVDGKQETTLIPFLDFQLHGMIFFASPINQV